ncbi:hypothetical protein ACFLTP_02850 [Chloroflexota bacterium]
MVLEKLKEYINAKDELQKAYGIVCDYGMLIGEVSKYLNQFPFKITISNVGIPFPRVGRREYTLSGNDWPTAKQLAEVLADYLNKRTRAKHLYDGLLDAQRQTLQPHPDI